MLRDLVDRAFKCTWLPMGPMSLVLGAHTGRLDGRAGYSPDRSDGSIPLDAQSSVDEIRQRFDQDVERFSNLEIGQTTTVDSPLMLELVTQAAAATLPAATHSWMSAAGGQLHPQYAAIPARPARHPGSI